MTDHRAPDATASDGRSPGGTLARLRRSALRVLWPALILLGGAGGAFALLTAGFSGNNFASPIVPGLVGGGNPAQTPGLEQRLLAANAPWLVGDRQPAELKLVRADAKDMVIDAQACCPMADRPVRRPDGNPRIGLGITQRDQSIRWRHARPQLEQRATPRLRSSGRSLESVRSRR